MDTNIVSEEVFDEGDIVVPSETIDMQVSYARSLIRGGDGGIESVGAV